MRCATCNIRGHPGWTKLLDCRNSTVLLDLSMLCRVLSSRRALQAIRVLLGEVLKASDWSSNSASLWRSLHWCCNAYEFDAYLHICVGLIYRAISVQILVFSVQSNEMPYYFICTTIVRTIHVAEQHSSNTSFAEQFASLTVHIALSQAASHYD